MSAAAPVSFRRVEHHMSTAITLAGAALDDAIADDFFTEIGRLEGVLSRFRGDSDISRLARGELDLDAADPATREVLGRCETLRGLTGGDFDHEPRRRSGDPRAPVLDVDAVAKGWIVEEAAVAVRLAASEFFVNAGGDVIAGPRSDGGRWRVGIQHPSDRSAVLGVFEVARGAVATSGTYERGAHIRSADGARLVSVTVVGPELAMADGLSTAVFAAGQRLVPWWADVDPAYGLLTLDTDGHLRWVAAHDNDDIRWHFPGGAVITEVDPRP